MKQHLAHIALVIDDYDEAITYFTEVLNFVLIEDTTVNEDKRWVTVAPTGAKECSLLLVKASNEEQTRHIGNQTGWRVFLFLFTDDMFRDIEKYSQRGVHIEKQPTLEAHGTVAIFQDKFGNRWDLIQPSSLNKGQLPQ